MPPISVDKAIQAMELIDHPFYVFRNEASYYDDGNIIEYVVTICW